MKRFSALTLVVLAIALGLGAGWLLRARKTAHETAQAPFRTSSMSASEAMDPVDSQSPAAAELTPDNQLERGLMESEGVMRWLHWMEAIETADLSDFPRLLRLAKDDPTTTRLVAQRWIERSPQHMFESIIRDDDGPMGLLLTEWTKRDPEAVIAALNRENFGRRQQCRERVARIVFDTEVERGLQLMEEWRIERFTPRMNAVETWAAANPHHAASFTLQHQSGSVSEAMMKVIGREWAKSDPGSALSFVSGKAGQLESILADAALKEWAGRSVLEAASWLARADVKTRNQLGAALVEVWAPKDPSGAMAWCEANLNGSSLAQAVGRLFKGVAHGNPSTAAAMVLELAPSPARASAAAAVAWEWFPELGAHKPVAPEAVDWLRALDNESLQRALQEVQWRWAWSDPDSLAGFLVSMRDARLPRSIYGGLASSLAQQDPLKAIHWASQLPPELATSVGSDAFAQWWSGQPEAAMQWLRGLDESDARRQAFFEASIRVLAAEAQPEIRIARMNATERAAAQEVVGRIDIPDEQRSRLLEKLKAP